MRYRISLSIEVDAQGDAQSLEYARKLKQLLESPTTKMMVELEGIRLSGNGRPTIYQPQKL